MEISDMLRSENIEDFDLGVAMLFGQIGDWYKIAPIVKEVLKDTKYTSFYCTGSITRGFKCNIGDIIIVNDKNVKTEYRVDEIAEDGHMNVREISYNRSSMSRTTIPYGEPYSILKANRWTTHVELNNLNKVVQDMDLSMMWAKVSSNASS